MKACPTNTLQPVWLMAGSKDFLAVMTRGSGPARQNAIPAGRSVHGRHTEHPPAEKKQAKVGTAWIARQNCLVWEQDKKCLVCDEVCPYSAVSFKTCAGAEECCAIRR